MKRLKLAVVCCMIGMFAASPVLAACHEISIGQVCCSTSTNSDGYPEVNCEFR